MTTDSHPESAPETTPETDTDTVPDTAPRGLELDRLGPWLAEHVPGAGSTVTAIRLAGGKSNLTYEVTDGQGSWIVRRPPLGHVLATAHDMGREYRVMTALHDTEVPVPRTYAMCEDTEVIGAPFYVMEKIAGVPYRRRSELEPLGPEHARAVSERLVDTLGALHRIDPASVGLADFGRPEGYLARQVARWKKQLDSSYNRDLPTADELHARLEASVPVQSPPGIVHGDYRLDNVLTSPETGELLAVVDWEMSTLGDPISDPATMVVYMRMAQWEGEGGGVTDVSNTPGYLSEAEVLDRYARASGRDLSRFGFYLGLAAYKLAVILEGIHYRYLHGQTVGPGFDTVGNAVPKLLDLGLTALKEEGQG